MEDISSGEKKIAAQNVALSEINSHRRKIFDRSLQRSIGQPLSLAEETERREVGFCVVIGDAQNPV